MEGFTLPLALFLSVGAIGMWSFIAVAAWSDNRRREREAYYRSETLKRIAEIPAEHGLALLREDERNAMRRRRENLKVGGLAWAAAGTGVLVFLRSIAFGVYLVGLIPLLVGAAVLAYAYLLAPKE